MACSSSISPLGWDFVSGRGTLPSTDVFGAARRSAWPSRQQVDHPWKPASAPMGARPCHPGTERGPDLGQGVLEVGLSDRVCDDDHPGSPSLAAARQASSVCAWTPSVALTTTRRGRSTRVRSPFRRQSRHSRCVEQVDLGIVDRERRNAVRWTVGERSPLARSRRSYCPSPRSPARDGAGGGQERFGERRLPGAMVPDEGDVSDCGRVVMHLVLRPCCWRGCGGLSCVVRVYGAPPAGAQAEALRDGALS